MFSLEQFYEQFQLEVNQRALGEVDNSNAEGNLPDFKENAFTELILEQYLSERGVADSAAVCHYYSKTTKGIIKLNAWAVDEGEGLAVLCVSLYSGASSALRLTNTDIDTAVSQAIRAFDQAVSGFHEKMEPASEAYGMMRRLYEARADIVTVEVVLLSDGLFPAEVKKRPTKSGPYVFKYDYWDMQRLYRLCASDLPYESVVINLEERFGLAVRCLPAEQKTDDHTVYLAVVSGEIFCELYNEFGPQLLDLNVRSFLQAKGKVNRGIRETLCKEPARFLAYNNGISATAEHVEIVSNGDGIPSIRTITGFQVVNGGQTMASIHRAAKVDKADISKVFVQTKITVVIPEKIQDLAPLISRYANSQNKISDADFSSNDPFHVELQHLAEKIWAPGEQTRWFYERTRGQYQVQKFREGPTPARAKRFELRCPSSQRFTKTDMAKYLNCWNQCPHTVSLGAQKNFVAFMAALREDRPKDWLPDESFFKELIAKAILFKAADRAAHEANIQAYKANVVAYLVSFLSKKSQGRLDLLNIWNKQEAPGCIREAFRQWAQPVYDIIVESAGSRNVTEWCKKESCWKEVCAADLAVPSGLRQEFDRHQPLPTVGSPVLGRPSNLGSDDRENIARTMQVDATTWFQLSDWGRKKKKLQPWQCAIAMTLSGYAQGNWENVPSAKQAKQAIRILQIAEDEGML